MFSNRRHQLQRYPDEKPDKMKLLAREHAFNRDYDKAEECAQFINDNMEYPRDHYDHCYGVIIEAAAVFGDSEKITYAASKMTHYVKDHFENGADLLVARVEYQRAMEFADQAMRQGYLGSSSVGYWGSTQLRIARNILRQDRNQISIISGYLGKAVDGGIGSHDLQQIIDLITEFPELDPDGTFILKIFESAFQRNRSFIAHDAHRIMLKNLRTIILAKAQRAGKPLVRIGEAYTAAEAKVLGATQDRERDEGGRYLPEPGRSPADALKVIAFSESLRKRIANDEGFTIKEFHVGYNQVREFFRFKALPSRHPDSQSRRDLTVLAEEGILQVDKNGKAHKFILTKKGQKLLETDKKFKLKNIFVEEEKLAERVGVKVAPPVRHYTLFTCSDFYKSKKEFETDKVDFGSRFGLEWIKSSNPKNIVDRILGTISSAKLIPQNVMVQLPEVFSKSTSQSELQRLLDKAPGIKFMIINTEGLKNDDNRAVYRRNLYAIMLLTRKIDKTTSKQSNLYRLLQFFISGCLGDDKKDLIANYMNALVNNDIALLINTILSYKPVEKYDVPDYDKVAAALISA